MRTAAVIALRKQLTIMFIAWLLEWRALA